MYRIKGIGMIAASVMLLTAHIHWSHLYRSNDFSAVKQIIAVYMRKHYTDVPYTIHLTRSDGQEYSEQVEIPSVHSLN